MRLTLVDAFYHLSVIGARHRAIMLQSILVHGKSLVERALLLSRCLRSVLILRPTLLKHDVLLIFLNSGVLPVL